MPYSKMLLEMVNNYSLFTSVSDWNNIKKIQQLSLFGSFKMVKKKKKNSLFEEVLIKERVIPAECV